MISKRTTHEHRGSCCLNSQVPQPTCCWKVRWAMGTLSTVWIKNNKAAPPLASNTVQSKVSEFCLFVDRTQRAHGDYRDHLCRWSTSFVSQNPSRASLTVIFHEVRNGKETASSLQNPALDNFFLKKQLKRSKLRQGACHRATWVARWMPIGLSLSLLHTNSHNWAQLCSTLITLFYPSCALCPVYFWVIQKVVWNKSIVIVRWSTVVGPRYICHPLHLDSKRQS